LGREMATIGRAAYLINIRMVETLRWLQNRDDTNMNCGDNLLGDKSRNLWMGVAATLGLPWGWRKGLMGKGCMGRGYEAVAVCLMGASCAIG
jgi:hypothetical protein